jgi:hypothetical protein
MVQFPNWSEEYTREFLSGDAFAKLRAQHHTPEGAFVPITNAAGEVVNQPQGEEESKEDAAYIALYSGYDDPKLVKYPYVELKDIFPPKV